MNTKVKCFAVVGASGLIGRQLALQLARTDNTVVALGRRAVDGLPSSIAQHTVDFNARWQEWNLPSFDTLFCALGTTIKVAGSQAAFRTVDFDYVVNTARAAKAAGANRMAVVSTLGASPTSSTFYNRTKGEMEQALIEIGFEHLVIVRPSLLDGDRSALGQATRTGEAIGVALSRAFAFVIPKKYRAVPAGAVARSMINAIKESKARVEIIESQSILNSFE